MSNSFTGTVDASELTARLERIRGAAQSQPTSMAESAKALDTLVRKTWREERDPWGVPWPPLKPGTLKARERRENFGVQMLFDKGEMFDSIHRFSDGQTAGVSVGEGIDHPADVHQFGSSDGRVPARPYFPMRTPDEADFPEDWFVQVVAPIERAMVKAAEDIS